MNKEQTLLIVTVVVGGLIVWGDTGTYSPVELGGIRGGESVETLSTVDYEFPTPSIGEGRSLYREFRTERREEPPELALPDPVELQWLQPLPWPRPGASAWARLRRPMELVAGAGSGAESSESPLEEAGYEDDEGAFDEGEEDGDDPLGALGRKRKTYDLEKAAILVYANGDRQRVILVPGGRHKSEPTWKLLEDWPNVEFSAKVLDPKGRVIATVSINPTEDEAFTTIHLEQELLKQYHERRIREGVTPSDRAKLIALAEWVRDELVPKYHSRHIEAVKLAIADLEQARTIQSDFALIRTLGELYQLAYDPEGELRVYREFLSQGRENDPQVIALLADAYQRQGALAAAKELLATAVVSGDLSHRLQYADVLFGLGEFDAAATEYAKVRGASDPQQKGHALLGMARVAFENGDLEEALRLAQQAKTADASSGYAANMVGSVQYALGRTDAAITAFEQADGLLGDDDTRARSNKGFALAAAGRVGEAVEAFESCLATDPVNYFDPMVGLGYAYQRRGDLTASNDAFETARRRNPLNPWIHVRLARIRLRDGFASQAIELGKRALELEPRATDALEIVGLAAQRLAEPDHDQAVRYLARAYQREPANTRLAYSYARELLLANRVRDAQELLAALTDVATGAARNDGRVLLLAAFSAYLAREPVEDVIAAINRAIQKDLSEDEKAYALEFRERVTEWDATRVWTDSFVRAAQDVVGWEDGSENKGVRVTTTEGNMVISTRPGSITASGGPERDGTRVTRDEDLDTVLSVEARFKIETDQADALFHLVKGGVPARASDDGGRRRRAVGTELGLGMRTGGGLYLTHTGAEAGSSSRRGGNNAGLQEEILTDADGNERQWPDRGEFHTVRFERVDHVKGIWNVYLDDELVRENLELVGLKRQNGTFQIGFLVDGDRGASATVTIDYVQVRKTIR